MKRFGQLHVIVTDKHRSYGATMKAIANVKKARNRLLTE